MSFSKRSLLLLTIIFLSGGLFAQSVNEAGAKYNEGNENYKAKDYAAAAASYEEALKIAKEVGPDAADIKSSIEKQLVNAYMKNGLKLYKSKDYDASIASLEKSYELAQSIGDTDTSKKLKIYISKIRVANGNSMLKDNNTNDAFAEYKMASEIYPKNEQAYYGMGLVYKTNGDIKNMLVNMDKAIEAAGTSSKKAKTAKKAKVTAAKTLVFEGATEIQKEHPDKGIEYITQSFNYMPGDGNTYYYLTLAYNKKKEWTNAIDAGKKAIELTCDNMGDANFALGQAYEGNGNTAEACAAYKLVTTGPNVEAAKYQMTQVLKCN